MTSGGILTAAESASVRREYRGASLLPKRTYHDQAVFDWERANVLRRDWVMVAREEDVAEPGTYMLVELDDDPLIIIRGRDMVLRAFHNVCRHRGTAVAEEPCGKVVRLQCPYHAWIYDLDGSLIRAKHTEDLDDFSFDSYGLAPVGLDTWQGFIFLSLNAEARAAGGATGRPRRAHGALRLHRSALGQAHGVLGRGELEVHRRELQRVLPLPGRPSPAQQAHALRRRRRLRSERRLAGRLDGAGRRRPDDGPRRRPRLT